MRDGQAMRVDREAVSVAIPVLNGARTLDSVLSAVRAQVIDLDVELIICDSGSHDESVEIAAGHGARVLRIDRAQFSHGGTRNLLMTESRGQRVAFLTQDAEPVDDRWLARLVQGFEIADGVALVYGPYRPRPSARPVVSRELKRWFDSLAPDGRPRVDRLSAEELGLPARLLLGRRTYFTDVNGCVSREAWRRVPFRSIAYAEDHALALDALRAGYAKVFVPDAPVWHSHDYTALQEFRRAFDEWRALWEVYGWREPADPRRVVSQLRGKLGADRRELVAAGASGGQRVRTLAGDAGHHVVHLAGALLGSRADRLPAGVRAWCSLEGRAEVSTEADPPTSYDMR